MNDKPAVDGLTTRHDSVHRALMAPPQTLPGRLIRWMVERGARDDMEDHTGRTWEEIARAALDDSNFLEHA
jgi:hypothetical protein